MLLVHHGAQLVICTTSQQKALMGTSYGIGYSQGSKIETALKDSSMDLRRRAETREKYRD